MITQLFRSDGACLGADLHVDAPLVQQLTQSVSPQFVEVFVSDRKTAGLISAQQNILQAFLLKYQSVFLQKVFKQVPVDLSLFLQVLLQTVSGDVIRRPREIRSTHKGSITYHSVHETLDGLYTELTHCAVGLPGGLRNRFRTWVVHSQSFIQNCGLHPGTCLCKLLKRPKKLLQTEGLEKL